MSSRGEQAERERYSVRYAVAGVPAVVAAEQSALGSDYGATGYTTRAQADALGDWLQLGPGERLLDIGSGAGWPGLHLAARSGCEVVVSDLTVAGMQRARERAGRDGLGERARTVVASARQLPFRPDCFDAVVHSDVLC